MSQKTNTHSSESRLAPGSEKLADLPWWIIATIGLGLFIVYYIATNNEASNAFWFLVGTRPSDIQVSGLA